MLKVILWDKSILYVEDGWEQTLENYLGKSQRFRLKHLANPRGDVMMGTALSRITRANYTEYSYLLPRQDTNLLGAGKKNSRQDLSEEELARRRAKLQSMKADFLAGKYKSKEANREQD